MSKKVLTGLGTKKLLTFFWDKISQIRWKIPPGKILMRFRCAQKKRAIGSRNRKCSKKTNKSEQNSKIFQKNNFNILVNLENRRIAISLRGNKFLDCLNHSDGRYIDATLPPGIVWDKKILIAVLSTTLEPVEEATAPPLFEGNLDPVSFQKFQKKWKSRFWSSESRVFLAPSLWTHPTLTLHYPIDNNQQFSDDQPHKTQFSRFFQSHASNNSESSASVSRRSENLPSLEVFYVLKSGVWESSNRLGVRKEDLNPFLAHFDAL